MCWCSQDTGPQPSENGLQCSSQGAQPCPKPTVRPRLWEGQTRHTPGGRDTGLLGSLSPGPSPAWVAPAPSQFWPLTSKQSRLLCASVCRGAWAPSPRPARVHHQAPGRSFSLQRGEGGLGLWVPNSQRGSDLQQLPLHMVANEVGVLAALAALQVVGDDGEGHSSGIQGTLQPLLLGQQQLRFSNQLTHLTLQL